MTNRQARIHALSEWLLEISALWVVFPLLDRLVENKPFDLQLMAWSIGMTSAALLGGIILRKGDPR